MVALGLASVVCLEVLYTVINKRRERFMEENGARFDVDVGGLGDRAVSFRYTL